MSNLFETLAEATKPEPVAPRREIKFRGKTQIGNHWGCGSLVICRNGDHCIADQGAFGQGTISSFLFTETVGQYTGLIDQHGEEIYEGDILKGENMVVCLVYFDKGAFLVRVDGIYPATSYKLGDCQLTSISVIGNIHDNPELLQ